ncbi:hypothetical protein ES319_A09G256700v1 [Gossypium barbadense]|uniref:Uncharacterized protein n=2 Tax=Gossypium TaxID=3633 RepID=A0A5J5UK50_GOSBA|nr:hypothetical protein ES319_A09G256700v1 [Gossypium barbadense]TYH04235.1 hypothetical protein ES288_A09G282800v1 [Gossypium darwinii]
MDAKAKGNVRREEEDDQIELRRGPWTVEEDLKLVNYIASHGEGRWNSLALFAGLKRTGKSCRLRWLNYLRPDVRRGNITLEEQLLILELHSRWGNRWSKIAQHLPGRTDNEIKNYWRTRVQKHAKQLKCDVNSKQFKDTMRYLWMPRLVERIQAGIASSSSTTATAMGQIGIPQVALSYNTLDNSSTTVSLETQISPTSDFSDCYGNIVPINENTNPDYFQASQIGSSNDYSHGMDFQPWLRGVDNITSDHFLDCDDFLFLQQQFNFNM